MLVVCTESISFLGFMGFLLLYNHAWLSDGLPLYACSGFVARSCSIRSQPHQDAFFDGSPSPSVAGLELS